MRIEREVAAVVIEISDELEASVKAQAQARGLPPDLYVREVLQSAVKPEPKLPLKTGFGMWAEYGVNISDEDIAENRADMFRNFGEDF